MLVDALSALATLVQRVTFDLVPGQHIDLEPLMMTEPDSGFRCGWGKGCVTTRKQSIKGSLTFHASPPTYVYFGVTKNEP